MAPDTNTRFGYHAVAARGDARPPNLYHANAGAPLRSPYSVLRPSIDRINRSSAAS
jgi:hypothetical protein